MLVLASFAAFSVLPLVGNTHGSGNEAKPPAADLAPPPMPLMHWGDFDGDGRADVFALYANGEGRLFHNAGDGTFADVTHAAGLPLVDGTHAALWVDYDGDGKLDLHLVASRVAQRLFHNTGDGKFEDTTAAAGLSSIGGELDAAWFDYDGDGKLDVMVRTAQGDQLLRNSDGRWFQSAVLDPLVEPHVVTGIVDAPVATEPTRVDAPTRTTPTGRGNSTRSLPPLRGSTLTPPPAHGGVDPTTNNSGPLALGNRCPQQIKDAATGNCMSASSTPTMGMLYPLSNELNVNASGNVLVGTTTVATDIFGAPALTVHSPGVVPAVFSSASHTRVQITTPSASLNPKLEFNRATNDRWEFGVSDDFGTGGFYWFGGNNVRLGIAANGNTYLAPAGGQVAIGTTTLEPYDKLRVHGGQMIVSNPSGAGYRAFFMQVHQGVAKLGATSGDGETRGPMAFIVEDTEVLYLANGGNVGIGTTSPQEKLDIAGSTRQQCVKITGGCDIVEGFETGGYVLEPGTVVVIDTERPGELKASTEPYDKKVAGVVSGAGGVLPGISLAQEGVLDGTTKVAMAGRVWVKCSAENGAIEPGDLLTTSKTTGHAMKVADDARSNGAVIGKAMTSLCGGESLVLVLVNLQ